jgi:nitrogen fixation NifU-like protein
MGTEMEEKKFNFWQDHTKHFLENAFCYERRKITEHPDGYGSNTGTCGDTIEMFLTVSNNRIKSVSYQTTGCINTNACCNIVAEMSEGKTIDEAWEIYPEDVISYLETLPPENHHCAELAVGAFYLALADVEKKKKNSEKSGNDKDKK